MKIALLSDIHGNSLALDAVLDDIEKTGGVNAYWCLGDFVALGPDPVGVLQRLERLQNASFIRGNTDRYVAFGDRPAPTMEEAASDRSLLPALVEVANTFAWTQGMVTAGGWLDWLRSLPLEFRDHVAEDAPVLCVHSEPGRDDGPGLPQELSSGDLAGRLKECGATVICVGHTHHAIDRAADGTRLINPGAVSLSSDGDGAARYAVLDTTGGRLQVSLRSVPYDRDLVIAQLEAVQHPGRAFLIRHLREA
jgi:predicted phosphodiesterase